MNHGAGEGKLDRTCEKSFTKNKEDMNILQTIQRRKASWICHILRRNCLLTHATEGKINKKKRIEVTGKRRRRRMQELDKLKGEKKNTVD